MFAPLRREDAGGLLPVKRRRIICISDGWRAHEVPPFDHPIMQAGPPHADGQADQEKITAMFNTLVQSRWTQPRTSLEEIWGRAKATTHLQDAAAPGALLRGSLVTSLRGARWRPELSVQSPA